MSAVLPPHPTPSPRAGASRAEAARTEEDFGFAELAAGLILRWRYMAFGALLCVALGIVAMIVLPPSYRAQASFVANSSGGARLPSSISSTPGLGAIAGQLAGGGGEPSESPAFYPQLIHSRELLTRLLRTRVADPREEHRGDSVALLDLLDEKRKDRARALELAILDLRGSVGVQYDSKTNLVSVSADAEWPELAAGISNRTVALVNEFNLEQRQSRGRSRRLFLERRLESAQAELARAEIALRDFNANNRVIGGSPGLLYQAGLLERRVSLATDNYMSVRREYESARVSEINDTPLITPVDSAIPPRKRTFPRIGITLMVTTVMGVLLGLLAATVATVVADWARREPETAARLRSAFDRVRRELPGGRRRAARG